MFVGAAIAKTVLEDGREGQPEVFGQRDDGVLIGFDLIGAGFGVLAQPKARANGPDAPADAAARLDHRDVGAPSHEVAGGGQTGEPRARYQHRRSAQRSVSSHMRILDHRRRAARDDIIVPMLPMLAIVAMTYAHPEQLVETEWVAAHGTDQTVQVVLMYG